MNFLIPCPQQPDHRHCGVLFDHDHDNIDLGTVGSPVLFSHNPPPDRTVWLDRSTRREDEEDEENNGDDDDSDVIMMNPYQPI